MKKTVFATIFCLLAGIVGGAELNVTDFGVKGDGKSDDSAAFDRAIEALKSAPANSTLKIPAGKYFFAGDGRYDNGNFLIKGLRDAVIEGEGEETLFLFGNPKAKGLRLMNGSNVTMRKFAIKYVSPIFAESEVLKQNSPKELIVKPQAPVFPPYSPLQIVFFRPDGTYEHGIARNIIKKQEELPDGTWKLALEWPLDGISAEKKIAVILYRFNNSTAFNNESNTGCTIEDVTIYSGPAAAFSASACDGISFVRCRVVPENGKMLSTAGDGVHAKNNRKGINIIDCRFRSMFDDAINITTTASPVCEVEGSTAVIDANLPYKKGDKLVFYDGRNLDEYAAGTIAALEKIDRKGKRVWRVTLDAPLPEIPRTLAEMGKEFDRKDLPAVVVNHSLAGAGSVISNCTISDNRARGILLRAPAKIEKCTLRNLRGPGILLSPELNWLESGNISDITIENNLFDSIGLTNIQVEVFGLDYKPLAIKSIIARNLSIRGNTFRNYGIPSPENNGYGVHGRIINITNGKDIVIENNQFGKPYPGIPATEAVTYPGSQNVTVRNNGVN